MKGLKLKMTIRNKFAQKIYNYIYCHSGQTILIKDIAEEVGFCQKTVTKYVQWLERRELIQRVGKKFYIPGYEY